MTISRTTVTGKHQVTPNNRGRTRRGNCLGRKLLKGTSRRKREDSKMSWKTTMICSSHSMVKRSLPDKEALTRLMILMTYRPLARNSKMHQEETEEWEAKTCRGTWKRPTKMSCLNNKQLKMKARSPIVIWNNLMMRALGRLIKDTIAQWVTQYPLGSGVKLSGQ